VKSVPNSLPWIDLNPLDDQGQLLADFVDKRDGRRDRGVGVDFQDAVRKTSSMAETW